MIGTYDPNVEPSAISVDAEAAKKWLNNGAQPTDVVGKIFKIAGIESIISTITFLSSFAAAAFTTERIAFAMRPCLPMTFPISESATRTSRIVVFLSRSS